MMPDSKKDAFYKIGTSSISALIFAVLMYVATSVTDQGHAIVKIGSRIDVMEESLKSFRQEVNAIKSNRYTDQDALKDREITDLKIANLEQRIENKNNQ